MVSLFPFNLSIRLPEAPLKTAEATAIPLKELSKSLSVSSPGFSPSNFDASLDSIDLSTNDIRYYAHESAIYINDEFNFNERILINGGIRLSSFTHYGPFDRYLKDGTGNLGSLSTDSTITYNAWEPIKTYYGFEPRFSSRILINELSSIKLGFNQNYQYIHLTSLSASSLPTDVWIPSSSIIKPLIGRQYSIGYYRNFKENKYDEIVGRMWNLPSPNYKNKSVK